MDILYPRPLPLAARLPEPRTPGQVWADTRPNPLRFLVELAADRLLAAGDAQRAAYGLTVERTPWGGRRVYDPRVPAFTLIRRERVALEGMDPLDRVIAAACAPGRIAALADELHTRAGDVAGALDDLDAAERRYAAGHAGALAELRAELDEHYGPRTERAA